MHVFVAVVCGQVARVWCLSGSCSGLHVLAAFPSLCVCGALMSILMRFVASAPCDPHDRAPRV